MNVLLLSTPLEHCCGISRHLMGLGEGLHARGHRVVLMARGGSLVGSFRAAGLEYRYAPIDPQRKTLSDAARVAAGIAARIRRDRIDVVHSHHRWPELIAASVGRLLGVRTVSTCHSLVRGQRALSFRSDVVLAVSEAVRRSLEDDFGVPPHRLRVIRNVARPLAPPTAAALEEFRHRLGVKPGRLVVVGAGRFHAEKGFDVLLSALAQVPAPGRGLHCVLAGAGGELGALQETVARQRLPVTFAGSVSDMALLYALGDIVVVPSRRESSGLVPLEAAAFGKPVIATAVGGLPEILDGPDRGLLVRPEDPHALADAIVALAGDAAARARLGAGLRAHVAQSYSQAGQVAAVEAAYRGDPGEPPTTAPAAGRGRAPRPGAFRAAGKCPGRV